METGVLRWQEPVHDVRIYKAESLVPERLWQRAGDSESQFFVKLDSRSIRAHYIIELHRQVAFVPSLNKAVLDKSAANASALNGRMHEVGGARNMRPKAGVIGAEFIHAK